MVHAIEAWVTGLAGSWWVHLAVLGLSLVDGFFPTVPSESVVISLASISASTGVPSLVWLILAAWVGAALGDNVAYAIGRFVGTERFGFLQRGRGRRAVEAAEHGLERRALLFLMTARYIPFGRTAVNIVAGAVGYPHRDFLVRDAASTLVWALYSAGIGALAGQWFEDNRLLGIVAALVLAVVLSLVLERLVTWVHDALDRRAEQRRAHDGEHDALPSAGAAAPAAVRAPRETGTDSDTDSTHSSEEQR